MSLLISNSGENWFSHLGHVLRIYVAIVLQRYIFTTFVHSYTTEHAKSWIHYSSICTLVWLVHCTWTMVEAGGDAIINLCLDDDIASIKEVASICFLVLHLRLGITNSHATLRGYSSAKSLPCLTLCFYICIQLVINYGPEYTPWRRLVWCLKLRTHQWYAYIL